MGDRTERVEAIVKENQRKGLKTVKRMKVH